MNELGRSNSTNSSYFEKSGSNYHAQVSKSLFKGYNKSVQIFHNNRAANAENAAAGGGGNPGPHPQNTMRTGRRDFEDKYPASDNSGYFTDRAAISVPSSRIENYYSNNTIEEEIQQLMAPNQSDHTQNSNGNLAYYQNQPSHNYQHQPVHEASAFSQYNAQTDESSQQQQQQQQHHHHPHHYGGDHLSTAQFQHPHPVQYPQEHAHLPHDASYQSTFNSQTQNLNHHQQQQQQQQQFHSQPLSQSFNESEMANMQGFSNPQTMFGSSESSKIAYDPKLKSRRGRPRKKPGFHLKLDGISKKPGFANRSAISSQSDSGRDYWDRTPRNGAHGLSKLSFTPAYDGTEARRGTSEMNDHHDSHDSHDNHGGTMTPAISLTPSIDPPAGGTKSYFEFDLTPKNEGLNNGGFFSPGIKNENVNSFNSAFHNYMVQPPDENHNDIADFGDLSLPGSFPSAGHSNSNSHDLPYSTTTINESSFTPLALNFDNFGPGPNTESSPGNELGSFDDQEKHAEQFTDFDFASYLDTNTQGNTNNHANNNNNSNNSNNNNNNNPDPDSDARLAIHGLYRTASNQSTGSAASAESDVLKNSGEHSLTRTGSKKRVSKGAICPVCDKFISRDLTRHMRIHNDIGRFQCVYPKQTCNHKTQNFNRPYDFKKHLLHSHFRFDDPKGKNANTLGEKLPIPGACMACGTRFVAGDWLSEHVLTKDRRQRCTYIEESVSDVPQD
ncbi:uncharacterized protein LODBEIA_P43020 [Lodderomyces beijingensis]|uniref:C2H2-type domain-containing protein n=1 Tax=Lodderomyces beijingensis TaxID=1775926 RepID=A0ABP0ZPI9_9ASCO